VCYFVGNNILYRYDMNQSKGKYVISLGITCFAFTYVSAFFLFFTFHYMNQCKGKYVISLGSKLAYLHSLLLM
jgi:hypothetical protein